MADAEATTPPLSEVIEPPVSAPAPAAAASDAADPQIPAEQQTVADTTQATENVTSKVETNPDAQDEMSGDSAPQESGSLKRPRDDEDSRERATKRSDAGVEGSLKEIVSELTGRSFLPSAGGEELVFNLLIAQPFVGSVIGKVQLMDYSRSTHALTTMLGHISSALLFSFSSTLCSLTTSDGVRRVRLGSRQPEREREKTANEPDN